VSKQGLIPEIIKFISETDERLFNQSVVKKCHCHLSGNAEHLKCKKCCEDLPRKAFSKNQWKGKQSQMCGVSGQWTKNGFWEKHETDLFPSRRRTKRPQ
jgi:hypothetical protein